MLKEYLLIGVLVLVAIGGLLYFVGSRAWGKQDPARRYRLAFNFYFRINRLKLFGKGEEKKAYLLHIVKIQSEITSRDVNFNRAKDIFDSRTKYELLDVYDDQIGHRFIKIKTVKHGVLIFEVKEFMSIALNKKYSDQVLAAAPADANEQAVKELQRKPVLKVIRSNSSGKRE